MPALADAVNRASPPEVAAHLRRCDAAFVPRLSARVALDAYAAKLVARAVRVEAWDGARLAGLVAMYCGDDAFITNVSVDPDWAGRGVGQRLLARAIDMARACGLARVRLEVAREHAAARRLYARCGFEPVGTETDLVTMQLVLVKAPVGPG